MSNVIQFKDLQDAREKKNKISGLKKAIKDWQQILNVKKSYIIKLQLFTKYSSIEADCRRLNVQVIDIESRIRSMKEQLLLISKGLE